MEFHVDQAASYIPIIGGVLIPFFVALLAKQNASGLVKSLLAALGTALTALAVYLENTDLTWEGAGSAFVFALIMAAASRVVLTAGADDALAKKFPGGVG